MSTKTKNSILSILVVIVASSIPALIFGKWLEAIIFIIAHTVIRPQFKRQYHHIMPYICRQITGIVFFFGISFILPFEYSLFSAIPINYFIAWIGDIKATSDYFQRQCIKLREKFCNDKQMFLLACKEAKLSTRDTRIALMYYYENKTPKEIFKWLCDNTHFKPIEWDSLYVTIYRIGKKIKKS